MLYWESFYREITLFFMNYFINNKKRYYIYINIIETYSYSFSIILYNYFKNKKYQLYL